MESWPNAPRREYELVLRAAIAGAWRQVVGDYPFRAGIATRHGGRLAKTAQSRAELGLDRVPSSRKVCQPENQALVVKSSSTIQSENILLTFRWAVVPLLDAGKFLSVPRYGNPHAHAARLRKRLPGN